MTDPPWSEGSPSREDPGRPERPGSVHLARVLAAIGGFVDAIGYVALFHLFTAHQSGNSAGLGVAIGLGEWGMAWHRFSAIGGFVVGVAVGTAIVEQCRRWRPRWSGFAVGVAELLCLAVALGVGTATAVHGKIDPADTTGYVAAATSLAGAMGLQNVALRRVGNDRTPSTYVTGIVTSSAELLVVALHLRGGEQRRSAFRRSAFLGSLWLVYLSSAIAGAAAESAWGFAALGAPIAAVAGVIVWQARSGYEPSLVSLGRHPPEPQPVGGDAE